jgi:hypothetical protein
LKKAIIYAGLLVGAASLVALPLHAAPPPGKGKPSSEATQNLSVPAILVGSLGTLVCGESDLFPSALVKPTGTPLTGYEVTGYYWVQKVHTWQAQCFNDTQASVLGAWGDNLSGDAKLKVGSPIRVEIVLTNDTDFSGTLQGYAVLKLQPSLADRLSAYGHAAAGDAVSGWGDDPANFSPASWVVHDAGMQISVQNLDTGQFVVPLQPIKPEINATGKIVYGYNLRVSAAGNYQIRFNTTPAVTFEGVDAGTFDANNAYLDIVVTAKAGGGGGKKGGKPK